MGGSRELVFHGSTDGPSWAHTHTWCFGAGLHHESHRDEAMIKKESFYTGAGVPESGRSPGLASCKQGAKLAMLPGGSRVLKSSSPEKPVHKAASGLHCKPMGSYRNRMWDSDRLGALGEQTTELKSSQQSPASPSYPKRCRLKTATCPPPHV